MTLLNAEPIYKPFHYPWAYDAWLRQQQIHWLPEEVPLADDVRDWKYDAKRNAILSCVIAITASFILYYIVDSVFYNDRLDSGDSDEAKEIRPYSYNWQLVEFIKVNYDSIPIPPIF